MALITSISGIRGTIGGKTGKSLSPIDIVRFTTAYALFIKKKNSVSNKIIFLFVERRSNPNPWKFPDFGSPMVRG